MPCPRCYGSARREVGDGVWECISLCVVGPPPMQPGPGGGLVVGPVPAAGLCGLRYTAADEQAFAARVDAQRSWAAESARRGEAERKRERDPATMQRIAEIASLLLRERPSDARDVVEMVTVPRRFRWMRPRDGQYAVIGRAWPVGRLRFDGVKDGPSNPLPAGVMPDRTVVPLGDDRPTVELRPNMIVHPLVVPTYRDHWRLRVLEALEADLGESH